MNKKTWAGLAVGLAAGILLSGTTGVASDTTPTSQSIRYCWNYDGASCSSPGTTFKCYNQYPYEPGICYCTSNYTWTCG